MKLGIDIGGSHIRGAVINSNEIFEKMTVLTPKTKAKFLEKLELIIDTLLTAKIKHIGIGCPGPADYDKGMIKKTPNIPLKNFNILSHLKKKYKKCNIKIENDSNCFVLGEAIRLKNQGMMVGITLGTGVGGGIVIKDNILKGKGNAGEIGRIIVEVEGIVGKDKIEGSLENYISSEAIKNVLSKTPESLTLDEWNTYATYLGIALGTINNILDPDSIVIGGNISKSHKKFMKKAKSVMKKRTINELPKIYIANDDSALIGSVNIF